MSLLILEKRSHSSGRCQCTRSRTAEPSERYRSVEPSGPHLVSMRPVDEAALARSNARMSGADRAIAAVGLRHRGLDGVRLRGEGPAEGVSPPPMTVGSANGQGITGT